MAEREFENHGGTTGAVDISAVKIDAGAELTVAVRASCPHGCDLTGQRIAILASDGSELAVAALDAEGYSGAIARRAPREGGYHTYECGARRLRDGRGYLRSDSGRLRLHHNCSCVECERLGHAVRDCGGRTVSLQGRLQMLGWVQFGRKAG